MSKLKKNTLSIFLAGLAMLFMTSAQAAMVTTSDVLTESNRAILHKNLERKDVQQQLIQMGVDPEMAIKRIDNMTDQEIAKINGQLDALPAGAGVSNVELLLIIIILILVL